MPWKIVKRYTHPDLVFQCLAYCEINKPAIKWMVWLKVSHGSSKQTPAPPGSSTQMPAPQDSCPTWAQRIRRLPLPCRGVHCWELSRCLASVPLLFRNPCSQGCGLPWPSSTELWESEKDSPARVPGWSPHKGQRETQPALGSRLRNVSSVFTCSLIL